MVSTIYESRSGDMWIGGSGGIARVSSDRAVTLGRGNGVPANVFSIVEDAAGVLWIGAGDGIFRLTLDEFNKAGQQPDHQVRFIMFDASDGSAGVPTRSGGNEAVRDDAGRLWFVTSNGLTIIDPRQVGDPRPLPPVRIQSAMVNARRIDATAGIELPAKTSHLQVDYTALNLTDPGRVRFKYRLDGFDSNWIDAGTSRQATYTNLPPGNYRLQVIAGNNDGRWNEDGAAWAFTILPTFYQTRTFYAVCALAACLLMWGAWQLRVRQVRKQFALVLAERIRMSRAIHDTLLQGLVGLALQINDLSRSLESSPVARDQISRMRRQVEEYIREARNSIWDLRSPNLASRDLSTALRELAERATAGTQARLEFEVTGTPRPCSDRVEEQLLVIGREAVSNAVRHGRASLVKMNLRYEEDKLELRVSDDGCGFDVEKARETPEHYGLISMRERAEQVRGWLNVVSGPGRGTEIEAVVPIA
jgi:signal transduction histidine kinase